MRRHQEREGERERGGHHGASACISLGEKRVLVRLCIVRVSPAILAHNAICTFLLSLHHYLPFYVSPSSLPHLLFLSLSFPLLSAFHRRRRRLRRRRRRRRSIHAYLNSRCKGCARSTEGNIPGRMRRTEKKKAEGFSRSVACIDPPRSRTLSLPLLSHLDILLSVNLPSSPCRFLRVSPPPSLPLSLGDDA